MLITDAMEQAFSFLGVIAVWIILSVVAWWLHRLHVHRKQRRRLALANEAWMRVREAPEIFADIRAAGAASGARDVQAATHALLNRVRDYSDFFDDVSALRAELARALGRDDCPPLTEILNIRRDIWAAADVLLIDDPAVFGDAFDEPGSYAAFCEEAEDLLFLDGPPMAEDPMILRLQMADEDMQTFVSGVEGEIADERERERLPTAREIIAYPVAWVRAIPGLLVELWRGIAWLGRGVAAGAGVVGRVCAQGVRGVWALVSRIPGAIAVIGGTIWAGLARLPRIARRPGGAAVRAGRVIGRVLAHAPGYVRAGVSGIAGMRHHPVSAHAAAAMRRASDSLPGQMSQGFARAADMARDVRDRARNATASARDRARSFEAGELGLHYDFLIKAHGLRQRYADVLRRAPELSETGRQFIARLELEKRSERLRLGTAKLRRRARLELVRILSVTIAALERLRDRLADVPTPAPQNAARLMSPLPRLFLPSPPAREAGAHFPGGLRAQARSWARGWSRPAQRMRDVTEEVDEADRAAEEPASRAAGHPDPELAGREGAREPRRTRNTEAKLRPKPAEERRHKPAQERSDDPTTRAARRVRGLFGIRDRKAPRAEDTGTRNRAAAAANGKADADRRAETATTERQARTGSSSDMPRSSPDGQAADAQILPPLRGSRTGNYDSAEANARGSGSLRSRLSGLNGRYENSTDAADSQGNHDEGAGESPSPPQAEPRGWRNWFGLRREGR